MRGFFCLALGTHVTKVADYIIVGAGSAGCVLASRLSEDPHRSVLLIEAGAEDTALTIRMPAALGKNTAGGTYNWSYQTVQQPHLNHRSIFTPRGKVLGGSSSINGLVYVRGHALDFDRWAQEGALGWSYDEVLPYFKKLERCDFGDDEFRGRDGPVAVQRSEPANVLDRAFLDACAQAGHPRTDDINGLQQAGAGLFDTNVFAGERCRASLAYLVPARARDNLTVLTKRLVRRVIIEEGRAVGVELDDGERVMATGEVILSAGAINTPQILMLSGLGDAAHLEEHNIPVVVDLPAVGANLQDHLEIHLHYRTAAKHALNREMRPHRLLKHFTDWARHSNGLATSNGCTVGAFLNTSDGIDHPDVQIHFFPVYLTGWMPSLITHGFRVGIGTLRATSKGTVRLASGDESDAPVIDPNYLATQKDRDELRRCVEIAREIVAQPAFEGLALEELDPGAHVQSDEALDEFVRATAQTAYHPCGTCRMGVDDLSPATPEGLVKGVDALRVVDASLMPSITSGNLNAPVMMMAERIADLIKNNI